MLERLGEVVVWIVGATAATIWYWYLWIPLIGLGGVVLLVFVVAYDGKRPEWIARTTFNLGLAVWLLCLLATPAAIRQWLDLAEWQPAILLTLFGVVVSLFLPPIFDGVRKLWQEPRTKAVLLAASGSLWVWYSRGKVDGLFFLTVAIAVFLMRDVAKSGSA